MRYGLDLANTVKTTTPQAKAWGRIDNDRTFLDAHLPWHIARRTEIDEQRAAGEQARSFLDEVIAAQITLEVNLDGLEAVLDAAAYDRSTHAAANTVRSRVEDMREISEALSDLYFQAAHPDLVRLLERDSPLADYLRGLEAWCTGVLRALEELALELRVPAPDWHRLRSRLDAASQFYLPELVDSVRADVARLRADGAGSTGRVDRLAEQLAELFALAEWFAMSINQRFG